MLHFHFAHTVDTTSLTHLTLTQCQRHHVHALKTCALAHITHVGSKMHPVLKSKFRYTYNRNITQKACTMYSIEAAGTDDIK